MGERLSDEELVDMLGMNQGNGDAYATRDEIRNVVSELRELRADALTDEEQETLVSIRGSVQYDWPGGGELKHRALSVLDRLLAAATTKGEP